MFEVSLQQDLEKNPVQIETKDYSIIPSGLSNRSSELSFSITRNVQKKRRSTYLAKF